MGRLVMEEALPASCAADGSMGRMLLAEALCRQGVPAEGLAEAWSALALPEPEGLWFFSLLLHISEGGVFSPELPVRLGQAAGSRHWDFLSCTGSDGQLRLHIFSREKPSQMEMLSFLREVRALFSERTSIALSKPVAGLDQVWRSFCTAREVIDPSAPERVFPDDPHSQQKNELVAIMTAHIHKNYQRCSLAVREIAQAACLSVAYACTLFKSRTGVTINRYISDCRIEKAKQLLADPRCKITDVAMQTGYSDSNYFGKSFKKLVGLSPSEYREKATNWLMAGEP